jgi:hypothetical protein
MPFTSLGAYFGPFVGVSLRSHAVQPTEAAVAATLIVPAAVFSIPPTVWIK